MTKEIKIKVNGKVITRTLTAVVIKPMPDPTPMRTAKENWNWTT